jgi:hypothetical protein
MQTPAQSTQMKVVWPFTASPLIKSPVSLLLRPQNPHLDLGLFIKLAKLSPS